MCNTSPIAASKSSASAKHFNATNPAKWMSAATDVFELVNFFEAQNTSYEVDGHAADKKKSE